MSGTSCCSSLFPLTSFLFSVLLLYFRHTRAGCKYSNLGRLHLSLVQLLQKSCPQKRQWWRLINTENCIPQSWHPCDAWLGTHWGPRSDLFCLLIRAAADHLKLNPPFMLLLGSDCIVQKHKNMNFSRMLVPTSYAQLVTSSLPGDRLAEEQEPS